MARISANNEVLVKTWCRICGDAFTVNVPLDFEEAIDSMYVLDDMILQHAHHTEVGGWGIHLRLDEVLALVFPVEFFERGGGFFPIPEWYEHSESENYEVSVVTRGGGKVRLEADADMLYLQERY